LTGEDWWDGREGRKKQWIKSVERKGEEHRKREGKSGCDDSI